MPVPVLDFEQMTVEERIELAEQLWDSVSAEPQRLALTEAQAAELDRRIAAYERDKNPGRPWREFLDELGRTRG
ncbi:MAG TPA: addiction module protein [Thermoanaerobaculia bacterium]|nr:addiction module protein [Thermoanaerobaculia bacterium]